MPPAQNRPREQEAGVAPREAAGGAGALRRRVVPRRGCAEAAARGGGARGVAQAVPAPRRPGGTRRA